MKDANAGYGLREQDVLPGFIKKCTCTFLPTAPNEKPQVKSKDHNSRMHVHLESINIPHKAFRVSISLDLIGYRTVGVAGSDGSDGSDDVDYYLPLRSRERQIHILDTHTCASQHSHLYSYLDPCRTAC